METDPMLPGSSAPLRLGRARQHRTDAINFLQILLDDTRVTGAAQKTGAP